MVRSPNSDDAAGDSRRWEAPSSGGRFGGIGRTGWLFLGAVGFYLALFGAFRGVALFTTVRETALPAPEVMLDGGGAAAPVAATTVPAAVPPAAPRAATPALIPAPAAPSPVSAPAAVAKADAGSGVSSLPSTVPAAAPVDAAATEGGEGRVALFDQAVSSKRVVYLLDVSGSMQGAADPAVPNGKSRFEVSTDEIRRSIRGLSPQVSFNVVLFADGAVSLSPDPLPATPEAKRRAEAFLSKLPDMGGSTRFVAGIREALKNGADTLFLTTDGGLNEPEWKVIQQVQDEMMALPVKPRIYTFGMTSGPMEDGTDRLFEKLCMMYGGRYQPMREWQAGKGQ